MSEVDVTIIGGGSAGYVAAIRAARLGLKVILIEKDKLGGLCLNRGCIPTKALVRTAELFTNIKRASEFGIDIKNPVLNFSKTMARKDRIVQRLSHGVGELMKANHVRIIKGEGSIIKSGIVQVINEKGYKEKINTKNILIASGSSVTRIPIPGVELEGVITSDEALTLNELPKKILIIGGGIVGIEWAGIFNAFGVEVTIIEILPRILLSIDEEIIQRSLFTHKRKGIKIFTNSKIKEISKINNHLEVLISNKEGQINILTDKILLSSGRVPDFGNINIQKLGIETEEKAIKVDRKMRTNIPGIYAAGDVVGKLMLAHVASAEGKTAIENIAGIEKMMNYKIVPKCVFSIPEISSVGLTEEEAKKEYNNIKVARFPYMASGKALVMGETEGLVKMIAEGNSSKILGIHIFGAHASDLIAEATLGLSLNATAEEIINTIHAHPTLAETIAEAAEGILGKSIHLIR